MLITESMILLDHMGELILGHIVWYNLYISDNKEGLTKLKDLIQSDFNLLENSAINNFYNEENGFSFTMENNSAFYLLKHREIEGYEVTSICRGNYTHSNLMDSVRIHPVPVMFEIQLENFQNGQEWYIDVKSEDRETRYPIAGSNKFDIIVSEFKPYTITIDSDGLVPKSVMIDPTGNLSAGLRDGYRIPFGIDLFRVKDDFETSQNDFVGVLYYEGDTGYMRWR